GRLRGREAVLRTHAAVHPGRVAGRRGKPGQPPGGHDPRERAGGEPRAPGHRRRPGAAERGDRVARGPARGPGCRAVVSEGVLEGSIRPGPRGYGVPGAFWRELRQSFRFPEFWPLSSLLAIIVRARTSRFPL